MSELGSEIILLPGEALTKPDGLLVPEDVRLRKRRGLWERRMKVRAVESSVTEILLDALGMLRIAQRLFLVVVRPGIWPAIREGVDGSQNVDPPPFSAPRKFASLLEWIFLHSRRGVRWSSMSRTRISDIFVAPGQQRPISCKCWPTAPNFM